MADLAELMKYAPTTGAGFVGYNQGQNEQMQQAKMAELQQLIQNQVMESQQKSAMHPLELEAKRLANQMSQVQIPNMQANSEFNQTRARVAGETAQGDIDSTNYTNRSKVNNGVASQLGAFSDTLGKVPALGRHAELESYFDQLQIPKQNRDFLRQHFGKFSGEQLPGELKRISEFALRNTPEYVQAIDRETLQQKGALERAKLMAQNRVALKGMPGAGGGSKNPAMDDIEAWLQVEIKGKPPATQFAILNRYIQRAMDAGNEELASRLVRQAQAIKAQVDAQINSPRAGSVDMGAQSGGRVQTVPPVDLPIAGQGGATPKPSGDPTAEIRGRLAKAGQRYEPDKYHYRIGPNGQLQKAPK